MLARAREHRLTTVCVWFLTIFLVLFPKGGIKAGILPITWGYLFFAVTTPVLIVVRLLSFPLRFRPVVLAALVILLPLQMILGYQIFFYGLADPPFAVSTLTALLPLPWIFILLYPPFYRYIDGLSFARCMRGCILIAALWGIFLFVWHPLTGHFIEIPYLTVNVADFGEIENTKHISRGFFLKLISTYNNGNLYGVATLILWPIYTVLEPSHWRRGVVRVALLLTLSRTVWVGIVLSELFSLASPLLLQIKTFPRLYLGAASKRVLTLAISLGLIFVSLLFNANQISFLLDPTAGGRTGMLSLFRDAPLLPAVGVRGYAELVYGSVARDLGWLGLFFFTMVMLSPVLLLVVDSSVLRSPMRRAAMKGLMLYAVLACVDGAFNYIPMLAFYWFAYMIYLFGWPGGLGDEAPVARPALPSLRRWLRARGSATGAVAEPGG
jgi:hypothetical protein